MKNSRQECFKNTATLESSDSGVALLSPPSCDTARYRCTCGFKTDDYHDYKDHDCNQED